MVNQIAELQGRNTHLSHQIASQGHKASISLKSFTQSETLAVPTVTRTSESVHSTCTEQTLTQPQPKTSTLVSHLRSLLFFLIGCVVGYVVRLFHS